MLDHHPSLAFPGEFEWPFDFMPDTLVPPLHEYRRWLRTNRKFRARDLEVDPTLDFPDLVRSFLGQLKAGRAPEKPRVGASAHRHYGRLLDVWPDARFIHLVRDGRDVCASWLRLGWEGNAYHGARSWRSRLREWEDVVPRLDGRFVEIRFEDLLARPRPVLHRICEFLGLSFEPAMLEYHRDTTYAPLDPGQSGKWRRQLAARDIRVFESVAGEHLERHGYPRSGLPPMHLTPASRAALDYEARVRQNYARVKRFGARLWLAEHLTRRLHLRQLHERVKLAMHDIVDADLD
jgi:hypothetical protein